MRKKESRFTRIDLLIVALCFAGALFSSMAFWHEYNATVERLNEEPVGTIVFQRRIAQRRFIDRHMWERMPTASLVFNGDTIRTIEQSEAIIVFQDEITRLNLSASTMIQIFFDVQEGTQVDFFSGNLEVASEADNFIINTGVSRVLVQGQAVMERSDEGLLLYVIEGTAQIDEIEMEAGDVLVFTPDGEISEIPIITMESLAPSSRFYSTPHESIDIAFSWNEFSFEPDTYVIIEISGDSRFNRLVESRIVSGGIMESENAAPIQIPLAYGNYWWRIFPAYQDSRQPLNQFFPSGALEIRHTAAVPLMPPEPPPVFIADLQAADLPAANLLMPGLPMASSYFPAIFFNANSSGWYALNYETVAGNYRALGIIADFLYANDSLSLLIEGHANHTISAAYVAYRQREQSEELLPLSRKRAVAVVDMLIELGTDPQRLSYEAVGGARPVAEWNDVANWHKNRRVEFVAINYDGEIIETGYR